MVTVYQCAVCKYPLLTLEESKMSVFFDDRKTYSRRTCRSQWDCARRQRGLETVFVKARLKTKG